MYEIFLIMDELLPSYNSELICSNVLCLNSFLKYIAVCFALIAGEQRRICGAFHFLMKRFAITGAFCIPRLFSGLSKSDKSEFSHEDFACRIKRVFSFT